MLTAKNVCKKYRDRSSGREIEILRNINLIVRDGEAVGLMGGSGSGKSTLARVLLRLVPCDSGKIIFDDRDITHADNTSLRSFRRAVQFISQRPESFLDPMLTLGQSLQEPFSVFNLPYNEAKVKAMLELVQLNAGLLQRYPHQLSGGEIQRICIARAMLLEPKLLILDEPTSMLDISVQAQILHLLRDIRQRTQMSYLFISHDKEIAKWLCDRVVRIEQGTIV